MSWVNRPGGGKALGRKGASVPAAIISCAATIAIVTVLGKSEDAFGPAFRWGSLFLAQHLGNDHRLGMGIGLR